MTTQADIDALDAAIARSELKVEIDGRSVTYRSVDELIAARRHLVDVLAAASTTRRRVFQFRMTTQRGD